MMNTEGQDTGLGDAPCYYSLPDRWIKSRLNATIRTTTEAIDNYRFDLASQAIYEFTWNEYCDWYLELSKVVLQSADEAGCRGTRQTLVQVLETTLRLAHPLIPFITEEIWQRTAPLAGASGPTVMNQRYPTSDSQRDDAEAEAEMRWVMDFILGVRRIRGEMDIKPAKPLPVLLQQGQERDRQWLGRHRELIVKLARLDSAEWLEPNAAAPESAIALLGELRILIPMAGLIDKEAELARLGKEVQRLEKELLRLEAKLADEGFVAKAPAAVVDKERSRVAELGSNLSQLQEQAEKIRKL
jgi:valyl-tRNA synthetase